MTTDGEKVDTTAFGLTAADASASGRENALDQSDINWQFFEASLDGVKILDREGRLLFVNGNGLKALEVEDFEAILSRRWIDLWPDASRADVEHALAQACEGTSARFTALRPTQKGTVRWWDVVLSPIKNEAGEVVSLMSISRDVTPSLTLADTLRRSEQQFQALANNIAQLAWMADATGNLFWLNKRWLDFTGSTLETSLGQGWRLFHHPDHVARVVDKWQRCTQEGRVWEDLFPLRGSDGVYRWFLSRAMPVRNGKGDVELWCGTNTDVTDARQQSQRLRKLARIIELSHEAMLVREIGGGIAMWNRGCEELFGYTKRQALSKTPAELLQPHNIPQPDAFDQQILAGGAWSGEVHYIASDGSDVWVDSRQELVNIGDKNFVLETNRDITDRRQADEVKTLLVAELNHRVKNTLAVVQSIAAQTARCSQTPQKFVASFNSRLQSLASAHNILSDVAWSGAPIIDLIRSQISVMGADEGRVDLRGEPVNLPPQTGLQLALILHELSTNAIQHGALATPNGRISISWSIEEGDRRLVELCWRETGGPTVAPPVGRGFGLTLIERSRSLPNIKTSISFDPSGVKANVVLEARDDSTASNLFNPGQKLLRPRVTPTAVQRALQRNVLIMDSSLSRAVLLEDMLDTGNYGVVGPLATASAAIEALAQRPVDLIAVDVDEVGDRDIDRLIELLDERGLPAVAIGTSGRLAQIKAGAFAALVAKPIDQSLFLRAVGTALQDDDVDFDDPLI